MNAAYTCLYFFLSDMRSLHGTAGFLPHWNRIRSPGILVWNLSPTGTSMLNNLSKPATNVLQVTAQVRSYVSHGQTKKYQTVSNKCLSIFTYSHKMLCFRLFATNLHTSSSVEGSVLIQERNRSVMSHNFSKYSHLELNVLLDIHFIISRSAPSI